MSKLFVFSDIALNVWYVGEFNSTFNGLSVCINGNDPPVIHDAFDMKVFTSGCNCSVNCAVIFSDIAEGDEKPFSTLIFSFSIYSRTERKQWNQ